MSEPTLDALGVDYAESLDTLRSNMPPLKRVEWLVTKFEQLVGSKATALLETLGEKPSIDPLSKAFHSRLHPNSIRRLLDILKANTKKRDAWMPNPSSGIIKEGPHFRVVDEDTGVEFTSLRRYIEDGSYGVYIDNQITHVTADRDPQKDDYVTMHVHYKNGKTIGFPMSEIPISWRHVNRTGGRMVRIDAKNWPNARAADHYVVRGGFVYPVDKNGKLILSSSDTQNLVYIRSTIVKVMNNRAVALFWAEVVYAFSGAIKQLAGHQLNYRATIMRWGQTPTGYYGVKNGKIIPTTQPVGVTKNTVLGRPDPPPTRRISPPGGGGKNPPPGGGGNPPGGGSGSPPPGGNGKPSGGGKGQPKLTVIQGGAMRPSGVPTSQESLKAAAAVVKDPKGVNHGKPVFLTVPELDRYWRSQGFKLATNNAFGPPGPDNRQLIYVRQRDNVIAKIKTAGYAGGRRAGKATMSVEVGDGKGVGWQDALFKVDAKGHFVAKNNHGVQVEIVPLPAGHPARAQGMQYGFHKPGQDPMKMQPVTKMEMFQGGQGPKPDMDAWADRSHFDFPPGFNPAGAGGLMPD